MANDRLYLACVCGEKKLLVKYYPYNGSYAWEPEKLGAFVRDHLEQCGLARQVIERLPFNLETEATVNPAEHAAKQEILSSIRQVLSEEPPDAAD